MLAVSECRLENQAPIGSCLDPTFSSSVPPTISRRLLSVFEPRTIHKPKILPRVTSCNPLQSEKCLKHLERSTCALYKPWPIPARATSELRSNADVVPSACVRRKRVLLALQ